MAKSSGNVITIADLVAQGYDPIAYRFLTFRARYRSEMDFSEEALRAAAAIGDDRLQKMASGRVQPERFTHGTSAQRVEWFGRGMKTGDPRQCDTFAALTQ